MLLVAPVHPSPARLSQPVNHTNLVMYCWLYIDEHRSSRASARLAVHAPLSFNGICISYTSPLYAACSAWLNMSYC